VSSETLLALAETNQHCGNHHPNLLPLPPSPCGVAFHQADFHDKTTKDDEPFYIIRAGIR
jgi:hypothetical protein